MRITLAGLIALVATAAVLATFAVRLHRDSQERRTRALIDTLNKGCVDYKTE